MLYNDNNMNPLNTLQELSFRKQNARQLRTRYVEGIYRPKYYTVTLKCRLKDLKVTGNSVTGNGTSG